jgi:hypothetical protein
LQKKVYYAKQNTCRLIGMGVMSSAALLALSAALSKFCKRLRRAGAQATDGG